MGRTEANSRLRWIIDQIWIDVWAATAGFVVNSLFGAEPVPRALRWIGYRAVGLKTATPNIFPHLRVAGLLRNVSIGSGTFINRECLIECVGKVRIGQDCQFGPQVTIVTSHHPWNEDGTASKETETRAVHIGDRVFLGARCLVLPGVTVADGVTIAAGAVVASDCLQPGLYAGVPARLIKHATAGQPASE